jgi:hypothetical protein
MYKYPLLGPIISQINFTYVLFFKIYFIIISIYVIVSSLVFFLKIF